MTSPASSLLSGPGAPPIADEKVILTPKKKTEKSSVILIEKRRVKPEVDDVLHVAGGEHKGLVINNDLKESDAGSLPCDVSLEFRVFLADPKNKSRKSQSILIQENRCLKFWFKSEAPIDVDRTKTAYDFFMDLVNPESFPRDYVSFIKKIMKLTQHYEHVRKIEVELSQVDEGILPESLQADSLSKIIHVGDPPEDDLHVESPPEVTPARLLELLESAYPNNVSVSDLWRLVGSAALPEGDAPEAQIETMLNEIETQGLIERMPNGSWMRVHKLAEDNKNKHEIRMVKTLPVVNAESQPTIAIITVNYAEKLAVDAMIEDKVTFVKYKAEAQTSESHVYTMGNVGCHRVISTKLPAIGKSRTAMIAAGNTTTRLLGSFQNVEHVFLVGVCGGVPHYTDYLQHPRLGDVIVSTPVSERKYIYAYCENCERNLSEKTTTYTIRTWSPPDLVLQDIVKRLRGEAAAAASHADTPWRRNAQMARAAFAADDDRGGGGGDSFQKPPPETDKLYMGIGGASLIEVKHPGPPEGTPPQPCPSIRYGAIGSGRVVTEEDAIRQDFANRYGIIAMDIEFDTVLEAIYGSRIDSFLFIRGVADYADGTKGKEWTNFAAINAAAYMKAVVERIPA